jgi:hypothetical protein
MRIKSTLLLVGGLVFTAAPAWAQRQGGGDRPAAAQGGADGFVSRLMKFDKNKDGKLTKDEVTDERLQALFDRADANHDGVVTADELKALYEKEGTSGGGRRGPGDNRGGPDGIAADDGPRGDRRGPPGGAGPDGPPDRGGPGGDPNGPGDGPGRRPGFGPGGPGGPGGFGGPQPGQILPDRLQEMLELTDAQKKQVAELQKDLDAKLAKILTEDQQKQLKEMRNRRPMRRGDNGPDGPPGGGPGERGGPGRGGPGAPDGNRPGAPSEKF